MSISIAAGHGGYSVRERGGRIMELSPGRDLDNAFFTQLDSLDGGDRMWISPEVDFFYEGAVDPDNWICPAELDPGNWSMSRSGDEIVWNQTAFGASFERRATPLTAWQPAGDLTWSGYRMTSSIESDARVSAWQLLMLPAPADIFVRTDDDPVVYYAPAPEIRADRMRTTGTPPRWKVGFMPPSDGRCVMAAFYDGDPGPLVVMTAQLDPAGTYVDVPPDGGPGTALQVFDSEGEGFCEMEMHAPLETRTLASEVVAAWGSRAERERAVSELCDRS